MLPSDYIVLDRGHAYFDLESDEILVGCKNFRLRGQTCPSTVLHNGKRYRFECIDVIRQELSGFICSAIRYKEKR